MTRRDVRQRLTAAAVLALGALSPVATVAECPHAGSSHAHEQHAAHGADAGPEHSGHDPAAHDHAAHDHAAHDHAAHSPEGVQAPAGDEQHASSGPEHCPMDEGETCSMYVPLPGSGDLLPALPHDVAAAVSAPASPILSADPTGVLRPPKA